MSEVTSTGVHDNGETLSKISFYQSNKRELISL